MQPWEWAIVFRGRESLEDLSWAQQFIEKKQIPPEPVSYTHLDVYKRQVRHHHGDFRPERTGLAGIINGLAIGTGTGTEYLSLIHI